MFTMENVLVELLVLKIHYFNIVVIYITRTLLGLALVFCYTLVSFQTSK